MSNNKVLVLGGGGRENAFCCKFASSPKVETIFVAPGNADIAKKPKVSVADLCVSDIESVNNFCNQNNVSLVVISPEDDLAIEISDLLAKDGISSFGPSMAASSLEANEDWAKAFIDRQDIPSAIRKDFAEPGDAKNYIMRTAFSAFTVKATHGSTGRGIAVPAKTKDEAVKEMEGLFQCGAEMVVIEEVLVGEEVTVFAFTDGIVVKPMVPVHKHKTVIRNQDQVSTLNSEGEMCACPCITEEELKFIVELILMKCIDGFRLEGTPLKGIVRADLVLTDNGPKLKKLHSKFEDKEARVILPLLVSDIFDVMMASCSGQLLETEVVWSTPQQKSAAVLTDRFGPAREKEQSIPESNIPEWYVAVHRDLNAQLQTRFAKLERRNELYELRFAQLYLMNSSSTAMDCISAFKPPLYRNMSFGSVSKNLLIALNLQEGNFCVPFALIYQAIGSIGMKSADGFIPTILQEAVISSMNLAGQKLEHHLLWLCKILQEISGTIDLQLKAICKHSVVLEHPDFADTMSILGFCLEMAPTLDAPLMSVKGEMKLTAKWQIFNPVDTVKDRFIFENGSSVIVDMMNAVLCNAVAGTWESAVYVVAPLTSDLNMILMKPLRGSKIIDVEKQFSRLFLHLLMVGISQDRRVKLSVPKFTASTILNLSGIELSKLVVALSVNAAKFDSVIGVDLGFQCSTLTKVVFTEGFDDSDGTPLAKRLRHTTAEETITFNVPFWYFLCYKKDFAIMAGRMSYPEQQ